MPERDEDDEYRVIFEYVVVRVFFKFVVGEYSA